MPLADRPELRRAALEVFSAPLPGILHRAIRVEVRNVPERQIHIEIVGDPPLPEELDEMYQKANGVHVELRWMGMHGESASRQTA